jgi:hypothetical protein
MGKYFTEHNGQFMDWRFKVSHDKKIHCFYLGEYLIAQIFKMHKNKWTCVPSKHIGIDGPVNGFSSRHSAAEYALQVFQLTNKS